MHVSCSFIIPYRNTLSAHFVYHKKSVRIKFMNKNEQLSLLPSIDFLLNQNQTEELYNDFSRDLVKEKCRLVLEDTRQNILSGKHHQPLSRENLAREMLAKITVLLHQDFSPSLKTVINATGVILHTGLGRAPLSRAAQENVSRILRSYSSLEIDLDTGKRGERTDHVAGLLCKLTGAEAALVVNNNAAAVFLSLNTLAFGKEAVISRGQLVEIGGAFRMPDVMFKSGCIMHEIGTTNKTKLADYENAISENTGAVVVAHTSNYRVLGFTAEVDLKELAELTHKYKLPLMHDLGAGVVVDLRKYGLPYEPLVQDSIAAGADVVTFSGDKVLGGPQSGIIVGKKKWIERIHKNPIMRAVRCDKMTYAALEATLKLFFNEKYLLERHKTFRLLTEPVTTIEERAKRLHGKIEPEIFRKFDVVIRDSFAQTGSGALPLEKIPSKAVTFKAKDASLEKLAAHLRHADPPVMGYTKNDQLYLDLRTVDDEEVEDLVMAINTFKNS